MIKNVFYEKDTEPYSIKRDLLIDDLLNKNKINVKSFTGHTLYDPSEIIKLNSNKPPTQYNTLIKLINKLPKVRECSKNPADLNIISFKEKNLLLKKMGYEGTTEIPKLDELVDKNGEKLKTVPTTNFKGGETEALRRLNLYLKDKAAVGKFEKPKTSPVAFDPPSTTTLSPYLKFGCLSIVKFYHDLNNILKSLSNFTQPPCSLLGQLYWREFFYCASFGFPNFHQMKGNPVCKQVNWNLQEMNTEGEEEAKNHLNSWTYGRTGYPWIDAIMIQLRQEGWVHHLARHCVACFLTRGDLYINWERGMEVFEELLLDADYALNAGNWLWLSGTSTFFTQYFRVYSPIAFPKKYDPNGNYIRKYIPLLKDFPKEFIYEPWKAPKSVQEKYKCIIGIDYPNRIVIHEVNISLN